MFHKFFTWLFGTNKEEGGMHEILNNSKLMNLGYIKSVRSKKEISETQPPQVDVLQRILDKEKMLAFAEQLGQLTGPELADQECREILESALTVIHTVTMGVKESIENI